MYQIRDENLISDQFYDESDYQTEYYTNPPVYFHENDYGQYGYEHLGGPPRHPHPDQNEMYFTKPELVGFCNFDLSRVIPRLGKIINLQFGLGNVFFLFSIYSLMIS